MKPKLVTLKLLILLSLVFPISLSAQQKTVTGKIVAQDTKEPLQGVTVSVKGSSTAVTTDKEGMFSVVVPSNAAVLEITYVGYSPQELQVGIQNNVSVSLASADNKLSEVVVVGYGTQRKRDVTGAMTSLKPDDFNKGVVLTPQQLLQGRAAGVNVTPNRGIF